MNKQLQGKTESYLTDPPGLKSWLLTRDHKRIGLMFLVLITAAIALGASFGLLIRTELTLPGPTVVSSPAAYNRLFTLHGAIMIFLFILPAMGIISEMVAVFSRKHIFGYKFIAYSSLAIALLGFLVWGHHMFVSGQSQLLGMIFSALTFTVAIPSAIKVFNWLATMYKGSIGLAPPMCFTINFIFLFGIGGLTGLFLGSLATNVHVHDTAFVVAHFHYTMVGGVLMAFLAGLYYWWPKMTGRMYNLLWGQITAWVILIGFNLTYFPQFIIGSRGMPRRYYDYTRLLEVNPEFTFYQIISTIGGFTFVGGMVLVAVTLIRSLFVGPKAPANPWGAATLEWCCESPPPHENLAIENYEGNCYDYDDLEFDEETQGYIKTS